MLADRRDLRAANLTLSVIVSGHMNAARMNHLRQVLEQDPKNTFARYALGMELVSNGETDEAVANFHTLLEVDANYVNAWFMGAQALHNAARTPEAIEWLHQGIATASRTGNRHAQSEMQSMLEELEG